MVLAAVPVVLIALLCVLLWFASAQMIKYLASVVPDWGIPFAGNLRGYVEAAAGYVAEQSADWLHSAMGALENVLAGPIVAVLNVYNQIQSAIQNLGAVAQWIINSWVIAWYQNAAALANSLYASANAYSAALYSFAEADINTLRSYAIALSQTAYTQAVSTATGLVNDTRNYAIALSQAAYAEAVQAAQAIGATVEADATSLFRTAERDILATAATATGLFNLAEADIGNALAAAKAFAQTAAGAALTTAVADIDAAASTAIGLSWPIVTDVIKGIEAVIPIDLPDVLADWQAIPRAIPTDLVGTIAAVGALAIPLTRYLRDCGVPMCNGLHDLSSLLPALDQLFSEGAIFALLAAAAADPAGAANGLIDTIGGTVNSASDTVRSMIGVG